MAAAWLAMEQFNARDSSVVAELDNEIYQNCAIKFTMNDQLGNQSAVEGTVFVDTASTGHQASQLSYQNFRSGGGKIPCAFLGKFI